MRTIIFWGMFISAFFLGCSNDDEWLSNVDSKGLLWLNYQTMVRASEDNLFLEMVEVDDNRCPIGVVCSTQGVANIQLNVRLGDEQKTIILQTGKQPNLMYCSEVVFNHRIEVVELNPYPYDNQPLKDKRGYIVKVKIEPIEVESE